MPSDDQARVERSNPPPPPWTWSSVCSEAPLITFLLKQNISWCLTIKKTTSCNVEVTKTRHFLPVIHRSSLWTARVNWCAEALLGSFFSQFRGLCAHCPTTLLLIMPDCGKKWLYFCRPVKGEGGSGVFAHTQRRYLVTCCRFPVWLDETSGCRETRFLKKPRVGLISPVGHMFVCLCVKCPLLQLRFTTTIRDAWKRLANKLIIGLIARIFCYYLVIYSRGKKCLLI